MRQLEASWCGRFFQVLVCGSSHIIPNQTFSIITGTAGESPQAKAHVFQNSFIFSLLTMGFSLFVHTASCVLP